jgi:DNA-binding transcriptional ArsR family regulator
MDIFAVIADPTRRRMIEMMAECERPAGDMVAAFPGVSQPAISQHLKVLRNAGLVTVRADKQRRLYSLDRVALDPVLVWIDIHRNQPQAVVPADADLAVESKPKSKAKPKPRSQPGPVQQETMLDLFG